MVLPCSVQNRDTQLFRDFEFLDERHSVTALTCPREPSIDELTRSTFSRKYRPSPAAAAVLESPARARADRLRSIPSPPPLRLIHFDVAPVRARGVVARGRPRARARGTRARVAGTRARVVGTRSAAPRARALAMGRPGSTMGLGRADDDDARGSERRDPLRVGDGRRPRDARPGRDEHQALLRVRRRLAPRASSPAGGERARSRARSRRRGRHPRPRVAAEIPSRRDPSPPTPPPRPSLPHHITPPRIFHARSAPRGVSNERSERSERSGERSGERSDERSDERADRFANARVAAFDAAFPGALPALNAGAVALAARLGVALGGDVQLVSSFDRKHYHYPDLPHGYQITQQRAPIVVGGRIEFFHPDASSRSRAAAGEGDGGNDPVGVRRLGVERIQLEMDTGKSSSSSSRP